MPENQHIEYKQSFIDAWDRGTIKIINSCLDYGLPEPKITEKDGGIEVTVLSSNQGGQTGGQTNFTEQDGLVKGLVKDLSENQVKLLELIEARPNVTKKEMAKHVGISTTAIDNNIKTLKEKGLLERVGGRKEGYWKIINPIS
jgi:ATP-dependent DNA helicase RecG